MKTDTERERETERGYRECTFSVMNQMAANGARISLMEIFPIILRVFTDL